jgi:hypothetical protein
MLATVDGALAELGEEKETAITSMDEKSFAAQLDRAIERSKQVPMLNGPKTIEHEPLVSSEDLKKPFQSFRRF